MHEMTRRLDERSTIRPLLAHLAEECRRKERDWGQRMDPGVLRGFRRGLDDADERRRLAVAAREQAEARFTLGAMVEHTARIYDRCLVGGKVAA